MSASEEDTKMVDSPSVENGSTPAVEESVQKAPETPKKKTVDVEEEDSSRRTTGRVRKQVERLQTETVKVRYSGMEDKVALRGKGAELSTMPRVEYFIGDREHLEDKRLIHKLLYGPGKPHSMNQNLLNFNGVVYGEDGHFKSREKMVERLIRLQVSDIRGIMQLLDVEDRNGTKEVLVNKLADFLEKPVKSSIKSVPKKATKKPKATPKKTASAKKTPKKTKAAPAPVESEGESSEEEEEPPKKKSRPETPKKTKTEVSKSAADEPEGLRDDIRKVIADGKASGEDLTLKIIRAKLSENRGGEDMTPHKEFIKQVVTETLSG